jgi:hypothetical protein
MVLVGVGCQIGASPLSQQQLQDLIRERHIQPLAVEEIGGDFTVILYKDTQNLYCTVAFARNGIETDTPTTPLHSLDPGTPLKPVAVVYDAIFGNDILCLTINDTSILQRASTIKITFSKNKEMIIPVKNQGNMIVFQPTEANSPRIDLIIYDKNQNELTRLTS